MFYHETKIALVGARCPWICWPALTTITEHSEVVGFTIAEYLPFIEHRIHTMLSDITLFTG